MADLALETDKLLAELGISSGGGESTPAASSGGAPPPPGPPAPPPPPPPPAPAVGASVKLKTKSARDAQKEIDDIFDSVISFAGKTSKKKKTPPPVAPKPKRKIHVSSYAMQVKQSGNKVPPKPEPPKTVAAKPTAPPPPPAPPTTVVAPPLAPPPSTSPAPPPAPAGAPSVPELPKSVGSADVPEPVDMVAFGPGLEAVEVNCYGDFQISCTHDTILDDLEVLVKGPSGSKQVDITEHGNGQFSCSYLPTLAGEYTISIKVEDKHIPGSPFKADVKFAAYTDKCSAEGPGLVSGTTTKPCHFKIKSKDDSGYARLRIHVVGPSKAEPINMIEDMEDKCVNVTYHPSAPGDYTIRVLWGDSNVHGSPFTVPVTGETINDPSKVIVSGDGLKGGNVNEALKIFVEGEAGAGPGPLGVRMVGPSKPSITADDSSEEGVELVVECRDPGDYQLILKWGNDEVPSSPFTIKVVGEGRKVRPELCTARGDGLSKGKVGDAVTFDIEIPDEAGPGTLNVSVAGPHPPKPIEIINNQDSTMTVTYHPIAPGEYTIEALWGEGHILGSPFKANIEGKAVRDAKKVQATGSILTDFMKCNQLGTIMVEPKDGAGAGPLRAKLEGPSKADLQLTANQDGSMLVSFIPKDSGHYTLHLLWGEGEDDECQINGSPFTIKVEK